MLLHYLKITFRNIAQNKFRYLLTTLGIAVGMVIFSIIFFFADGSNKSWDKKPAYKNLCEFTTAYFDKDGKPSVGANNIVDNAVLEKALNLKLPEIEAVGMIAVRNTDSYVCPENTPDLMYQMQCRGVNSAFFELAGMEMIKGGITDGWDLQKSVVLTENLAKKLFGNSETAIGQRIERRNRDNLLHGIYTVTGVTKRVFDPDFNSDMYFPLDAYENRYLRTIVRLKQDAQPEKTNPILESITSENINDASDANGGRKYLKIETFKHRNKELPLAVYLGLLVMGSLVLMVALLNFANLLLASMQARIRQFTLRKIVGANRFTFLLMLLCEIIPILIAATFLSYLMLELLFRWYQSNSFIPADIRNELDSFLPLILNYPLKISFWTLLGCLLLAVILVRRIQKIVLVQGIRGQFFKTHRNFARNVLLFFQLLITMVFFQLSIFVFLTATRALPQIYQSLSKEQSKAVLIVPLNQLKLTEAHQEISNRIKSLPGVLQITTEHKQPSDNSYHYITLNNVDAESDIITKFDGYDTFWEVNDPLFKRKLAPDEAIINRNFANRLEKDSLTTFDFSKQTYKVVGIVEQIPYTEQDKNEILVGIKTMDEKLCLVKCVPTRVKAVEKEIMKIIREYLPATIDYRIGNVYDDISLRSQVMQLAFAALGITTLFCLIITMLGIYTAVSYDVRRKRKEIAIRKINGATRKDIARQFAKLYAVLLVSAGFLGTLLHRFVITDLFNASLAKYNFSIIVEFIIWLMLVLVVTLTVFAQIRQAVSENPADVVKSE